MKRHRRSFPHLTADVAALPAAAGALAALTMLMPNLAHGQAPGVPGSPPVPQVEQHKGGFRNSSSDEIQNRVGRHPVKLAEWPSFVLVRYHDEEGRSFICGGTVIAPDWVLTAGHCLFGHVATPKNFVVTEGTDNLNNKGRELAVSQTILNELFSLSPVPRNDIALLHLETPAQSPAQTLIGATPTVAAGTAASLVGFGVTEPQPISGPREGMLSDHLMQVDIPVVARASCIQILSKYAGSDPERVIDDSTVCAGDPAGGRDSCAGDSGGPLAINTGNGRVQIGIISWGPGCAQRDTVGVYTAVGHFQAWIEQYVSDATFYDVPLRP